jgi:signal transduction histidine kinase
MRAKTAYHINVGHRMIWIGIGLAVLSWTIESAIHVFLFHHGTIVQQIFRPEPHEIWMRLMVVSMFIAFGIYAQFTITRRKRAEEELRRHRKHLEELVEKRTAELRTANEQLVREITERKQAEEHIHALTQQLMKAQENERQRISRDLHDNVAQDLSTAKIVCETLFNSQPAVVSEIRQKVSELSKILRGTIIAVRDLSYELHPPALDQLGLAWTVFQYSEDFSGKTGVSVDFSSAGMDDLRLDFDTEINLYRMIQEGFNNIKKHADASHVIIRLVATFPQIILRIEDDGKGFDMKDRLAAALNEKRMGLQSMEERVKLLHGKMRIQSRPMEGTKILIEVPYKEKNSGSKEKHIDC